MSISARGGLSGRLVLDCLICSIFCVIVILLAWPRYLEGATRSKVRNFGVTDNRTLGVFAGVVPFAVAAIMSVFAPLTIRYARLSRTT